MRELNKKILNILNEKNYSCSLLDEQNNIYQVKKDTKSFFITLGLPMSDTDSYIGYAITESKNATNRFLKENAYPHTKQILVKSITDLDQLIEKIGFPCVIKPTDRDKGIGVFCNINSKIELLHFLNGNKQHYVNGFILEGHVTGNDYRITIIGNKLAFVIKRSPPSITGDGKKTIYDLITDKNKKLKEEGLKNQVQGIIPLDAEVRYVIKKNGLSLYDILEKDKVLTLKSISNLSVGGSRLQLDNNEIHPEVISLCESISKQLNLFSLGIDYITNDIGESPEKSGGVILELNYNPELADRWFDLYLDRLLERHS